MKNTLLTRRHIPHGLPVDLALIFVWLFAAPPAVAAYPEFHASNMCGSYQSAIGTVESVLASVMYFNENGMHIKLENRKNEIIGRKLYSRNGSVYTTMTRMAVLAQMTKSKVRVCYDHEYIYIMESGYFGPDK